MTQLVFNKKIANEILNDDSLREELIITLNELIDAEFLKSDDEIDFEIIDTYTDALNELYMGKGVAAVFWKLQTVEEFIDSITNNKKVNHLAKIFKIVAVACAVFAVVATSEKVTQEVTGQGIVTRVVEVVQEILTGEVFKENTKTTTSTDGNNSGESCLNEEQEGTTSQQDVMELPSIQTNPQSTDLSQIESQDSSRKEETTVIQISPLLPNWSQVTTPTTQQEESTTDTSEKPTIQVTPQNPDLPEVLRPTTPPKEETTTEAVDEPFTRVDEDVTSAPIVIKLTGEFDKNFKRKYIVGEEADFSGLTVIAKYDNGETKTIPISECQISGFSTSRVQNCIVTVEYEGCSFSFLIRVTDEESTTAPVVEETTTQKEEPTTEETTTKPHNPELPTVLTPTEPPQEENTTTPSEESFTRVDEDVTSAPTVMKLTGEYSEDFKKDYVVGETADFSGLTVIAQYDNGETKEIPLSGCQISGFSTETVGNHVVTVEYENCSFSFLIKVKEEE